MLAYDVCFPKLVEFGVLQALVDAPDTVRCKINFKRLTLTDFMIEIPRVPKKKTLIEALEAAGKDNSAFILI